MGPFRYSLNLQDISQDILGPCIFSSLIIRPGVDSYDGIAFHLPSLCFALSLSNPALAAPPNPARSRGAEPLGFRALRKNGIETTRRSNKQTKTHGRKNTPFFGKWGIRWISSTPTPASVN